MNHQLIKTALTIVLILTSILFAYALYHGAALIEILAISFTGVTTTGAIALNEKTRAIK